MAEKKRAANCHRVVKTEPHHHQSLARPLNRASLPHIVSFHPLFFSCVVVVWNYIYTARIQIKTVCRLCDVHDDDDVAVHAVCFVLESRSDGDAERCQRRTARYVIVCVFAVALARGTRVMH